MFKKNLYIFGSLVFLSLNNTYAMEKDENSIQNSRHAQQLKTLLIKAFDSPKNKIIEKITRGVSSPGIYKIKASNKTLIFKIPSEKRPMNTCEEEFLIMEETAKIGLSPQIWAQDPKNGVLMDFILSEELDSRSVKNSDLHIQDLAKKLALLHKLPVVLEKKKASIFDIPGWLLLLIKGEPLLCKEAIGILKDIKEKNINNFESKLIHADLNLNNILYTEKTGFLFVDFELAHLGDPSFDLATISNYLGFETKQEKLLLKSYYNRGLSKEEIEEFEIFKKVHMIYAGIGCIYAAQKIAIESNTYHTFLSEKEINEIPSLKEYQKTLGNLFTFDFKNLQTYGYAFLKEALKK